MLIVFQHTEPTDNYPLHFMEHLSLCSRDPMPFTDLAVKLLSCLWLRYFTFTRAFSSFVFSSHMRSRSQHGLSSSIAICISHGHATSYDCLVPIPRSWYILCSMMVVVGSEGDYHIAQTCTPARAMDGVAASILSYKYVQVFVSQ